MVSPVVGDLMDRMSALGRPAHLELCATRYNSIGLDAEIC
jgi:hypothetical protein